MSGGVDSSVAAALLKDQGYQVFGVFMRFWSESNKPRTKEKISIDSKIKKNEGVENKCCSKESEYQARSVCEKLEIPFYAFDFQKEFRGVVVDDFLQEELKGHTPNPCIVCNEFVKFGVLLRKATAMGADYLATGHYARNVYFDSPIKKKKGFLRGKNLITAYLPAGRLGAGTGFGLLKGVDSSKDQSYFLYRLNQDQLAHILFPVGEYLKSDVYRLSEKYQIPFERQKKQSQDLCFLKGDKGDFLKRQTLEEVKKGPIINQQGENLGEHKGLIFYTIGQRKHLEIPDAKLYYVVKINWEENSLVVSDDEADLLKGELIVKNLNWVKGKQPKLPFETKAKIRYQNPLSDVVINKYEKDKLKVVFKNPQRAVTPGQSVVFYEGDEVVGGGIISEK